MKACLTVLRPGVQITIQDLGRTGFQDVGVPVSGPLDRIALQLANALVGNVPGMAALEIMLLGPAFEVAADSVRVALVGGDGGLEIGTDPIRAIAPGQSVRLTRGDTFRVGKLGDSACAYLAIEGGIDMTPVLGSFATYVRGGLGGLTGAALKRGDAIALGLSAVAEQPELALAEPVDLALDQPIRVVMGPQDDYFTEAAVATFLSSDYILSSQSDRMGFRLEGAALSHADGYNIVSDGIVAGSIQVPGSGQPIVLMADAQTTGGYPKIATVISADIPVLGHRRPGRTIRFAAVTREQAEALRRAQEENLRQTMQSLRTVQGEGVVDGTVLGIADLTSAVFGTKK